MNPLGRVKAQRHGIAWLRLHCIKSRAVLFPIPPLCALYQLLSHRAGFQGSSNTKPQGTCRETLWSHRWPMAMCGQRGGVSHQACLGLSLAQMKA